MRIVMHLDFDSFYASLEENRKPEIKGRPVVICMFSGRSEESGAVATASYAAREKGIRAGMPIGQAKSLEPNAVFLPADLEYYRSVSDEIMDMLRGFAASFEQRSIDEAYIDASGKGSFDAAEDMAKRIKQQIKDSFGITCSIGIGPNKLIAKMASRHKKPDGLTLVSEQDVEKFISSMPVDKIHGVGVVTVSLINEMGIQTVSQLASASLQTLVEKFGESKGRFLYNAARGIDDSPVKELERKQYSRIGTLKENTRDIDVIMGMMDILIDALHKKLVKNKIWFKNVSIIAITTGLQLHTKSRTLPAETNSIDAIRQNFIELMQEFLNENPAALRRCGVRVSSLSEKKQFSLREF